MSHKGNDEFLESVEQEFKSSEDGEKRANLIGMLREQGFSDAADELETDWYEERKRYVENFGRELSDVMFDEGQDVEYFWVDSDDGDTKVFVPDYLDHEYYLK